MKKLIALVLALVCTLGFVGCKPDGATDLIELGEVSAFVSEKGYTAEDFKEKLVGQYYEDIIHSWGEGDIQFSGFWGHSWYLDDNDDKYISLYYDENGYVKDIVIGNHANQTSNAIIADIVAEGIVSARFDSHIPNYIYDIEDLTIVDELLATLDGATYEVCERPKEPWGSIEAIYITTTEDNYYLGVIENSAFHISVDGEGEYYTCSCKDNFLNKLLELQGR
ncbi:MAG: hypothetical protein IKM61_09455 [Eubacteriaceae bacterium]|nr:hypothetical protein [Eubacteriaceae bacterium]